MINFQQPKVRPENPNFSSGPCSKRPGWSVDALKGALCGRSHRSHSAVTKIQEVIQKSREILGIPEDWKIGVVPASDTGAFEMAMWSLLGQKEHGVDMLAWESFGNGWVFDASRQLSLPDARAFIAEYGEIPDLKLIDFDRDVVFVWNGTTSGVCLPDGEWIPDNRKGLTICDATSAVFAMDIPWNKLDVVTWSWQKALGGEAQHGMICLSPCAINRLETYMPPWPLPKIFRLTQKGKLLSGVFEAKTINTPSMLAVEDMLDALSWAQSIGGLSALKKRSQENLCVVEQWIKQVDWCDFLAQDPLLRSSTSICLKITDDRFVHYEENEQRDILKNLRLLLEDEGVAYDIGSYINAPPGLRIWGGPTVNSSDIEALLPWLSWGWDIISHKRFRSFLE